MIINQTTKQVISREEMVCTSWLSQVRGLMGRRERYNLIMIFPRERRVSLHTFFVLYPLDIVILDSTLKVMEIKRNLKPFSWWKSKGKGKYVLELGNSSAAMISPGDQLIINN